MHLSLDIAASRHDRNRRAAIKQAVLRAVRGRRLSRKRAYTVRVTLHGHWFNKDGSPFRRDADSVLIPLLDEIAAATGIDDCQFRQGSWRCLASDVERVVVEIG